MAKQRTANISSDANSGIGLEVTTNKRMRVTGVTVAPRGADFAADVQLYMWNGYTGLGSNVVSSGDFTADVGTAAYTSDFSAGVDSWADNGGGGPTIAGNQTVDSVTQCLKITGTAGGDDFELKRAGTLTATTWYKVVFDYYLVASSGLAFLGMGVGGTPEVAEFDRESGKHLALTAGSWQTDQVLYGYSATTEFRLCGYTAKDGAVQDVLDENKYIAFKNVRVYAISNVTDWTLSDATKTWWDFFDGDLQNAAEGAATATQALTGNIDSGELCKTVAIVSGYAAGDVWLTLGGTALPDMDANGTYTNWLPRGASNANLVVNWDATGSGAVDGVEVYPSGIIVGTTTPIWQSSIRSGTAAAVNITFPSPVWSYGGFLFYASSAGTACIMDITVYYEIL